MASRLASAGVADTRVDIRSHSLGKIVSPASRVWHRARRGVRVSASELKCFAGSDHHARTSASARTPPLGLFGAIRDALPRHLAEQFWSLDTANGILVTLRTGQTFWFTPNTAVRVIVARIVEETGHGHETRQAP